MKLSLTQKKVLIPIVLALANFIYLCIGGLIFSATEYKNRKFPKISEEVSEILDALKKTPAGKTILPAELDTKKIVKRLSAEDLQKFDKTLQKYDRERERAKRLEWNFSNSFFFASTVVTTIGYGNIAPVTTWGRVVCVLYALIGIPLTLMVLATIGKIINIYLDDFCKWLVVKIRRFSGYKYETTDDIEAPLWIALPIMFVFLALMLSIYCTLESWDFGTALYFIVITFTTIGFGDVVPQSNAGIWINTTLLYVGLSIISIIINLFAASASRQMEKTGRYLKFLQTFTENEKSDSTPQNGQTQQGTDKHFTPFKLKHSPQWLSSRLRRESVEMELVSESNEDKADITRGGLGHESVAKPRISNGTDERHYGAIQE